MSNPHHQSDEIGTVTIPQLLTHAIDLWSNTIGEIRLVGTITEHRPRQWMTYAKLVATKPGTTTPVARIGLAFRPHVAPKGVNLNGAHVAVTGTLAASPMYGPFEFTVVAVEILDEESEATRTTRALREEIVAEHLDQVNKQLALAYDANRLGLIMPTGGGAGGADLIQRLDHGPHEWNLIKIGVPMGGNDATRIAHAITHTANRPDIDAVVVCRGGGPASDMAAFDSESVARAIVTATRPVVVAVGHATDHHIADTVAHTALATPTAAGDWLNNRRNRAVDQARHIATQAAQARTLAHQADAAAAKRHAAAATEQAEATTRRATIVLTAAAAALVLIVAVIITIGVLQ